MTRDEIEEKLFKRFGCSAKDRGVGVMGVVGILEELGLITVDKPKSVEDRAVDVLKHYVPAPLHVIHDLAVDGLKIVEK